VGIRALFQVAADQRLSRAMKDAGLAL